MATERFKKLVGLLKELFQLDQPDLDFGIYRVMHARSAEVTQFLEQELLPQVHEAFAQYKSADRAEVEREIAKAVEKARELGVDPEATKAVTDLRARLKNESVDIDALEADVYDHLYKFFRRYYDEGDFLSRRVYKAGTYAIPYEGEEVKLHWANADQYYIKTSEYLRDYAFRLRPEDEKNPMRVHFRLVDAAEGEHGNVREASGRERRFKLAPGSAPVVEDGELVIRFTFQPDAAKQKDLNRAAEERIVSANGGVLTEWLHLLAQPHVRADGSESGFTRLGVHLDRYTKRNTFDYFIHKDLGGFLRRELDFYIKNEVMHLDDIESESAPKVEQYLSKIRVIRSIAGKIIAFLAQLEDFQKALWLKKKFVVETRWCIALAAVPTEFHSEVLANRGQQEEWQSFGVLQNSVGGLGKGALVMDSAHFQPAFLERVLDAIGHVGDRIDGLLVCSENSQALRLLGSCLAGRVKCVYGDPPYNTGNDGFVYKDSYRHSTWIAMVESRLAAARKWLSATGLHFCSIDEIELHNLRRVADDIFGERAFVGTLTWKSTTQPDNIGRARFGLQQNVEYVLLHANAERTSLPPFVLKHSGAVRRYPHQGRLGACRFEIIERAFEGAYARPTMQFPILGQLPREGKQWQIGENTARALEAAGKIEIVDGVVKRAVYPEDDAAEEGGLVPFWAHLDGVGTSQAGKAELTSILGRGHGFDTVKPVSLVSRLLEHVPDMDTVADFFAGSGTTAHAAIALTRADGRRRRFILVEVERYFDSLLLPRVKRIAIAPEWADGHASRLPSAEETERSPRIVKVLRLESYEDALNNLDLRRTPQQQGFLDLALTRGPDKAREQYLLRYMLDVESRGSQSLLNVAAFMDPTAYKLKVKRPGSDESRVVNVDLIETFNWLIGLTVQRYAAPRTVSAKFTRDNDKDLPKDAPSRLLLDGPLKEDAKGPWWFRTVTGATPDGRRALVIWRKRPGGEDPAGIEQDNLVLDEWFKAQGHLADEPSFDVVWVNGTNNLENLKSPHYTWAVRLIEDDFHRLMFDTDGD